MIKYWLILFSNIAISQCATIVTTVEYTNVLAAINSAASGDTIILTNGSSSHWNNGISITGKNLIIRG